MNYIISITVYATFGHVTCEKNMHQLVQKVCRIEQNLGFHTINKFPMIETLQKAQGVCKSESTI